MYKNDVSHLICPECGGTEIELKSIEEDLKTGIVSKGVITCAGCENTTEIVGGVPLLFPGSYVESRKSEIEHWKEDLARYEKLTNDKLLSDRKDDIDKLVFEKLHEEFSCSFVEYDGMVLDVGGGPFFEAFKEKIPTLSKINYFAVDPIVPKKPFPRFMAAIGEALPFRNETFDTVTISVVLDHCFEPQKVLAETRRVMKKGGRLFVANGITDHPLKSSPLKMDRRIIKAAVKSLLSFNPAAVLKIAGKIANFFVPSSDKKHFHHWSGQELISLIEGAGFEVHIHECAKHTHCLFVKATKKNSS